MRCVYCIPQNNADWINRNNVLSYEQITRLAKIFAYLGVEKIKITGGEPTVRDNVEDLVKSLTSIQRIKSVSMTTNGLLLSDDKIGELKDAGLQSLNISLDTFRKDRFKAMTGGVDGLEKVLYSIQKAQSEGITVKINVVVIKGFNDDEIADFAKFSRNTGCIVKFIEFMPLDGTGIWSDNLVFSKKEMMNMLGNDIMELISVNNNLSDPARLYTFKDNIGTIGFIPSITEPFCQYCDRIRITSDGKLYTCLFDKTGYDLKQLLDNKKSDKEIVEYINRCMQKKPEGIIKIIREHDLRPTLNVMNTIGG